MAITAKDMTLMIRCYQAASALKLRIDPKDSIFILDYIECINKSNKVIASVNSVEELHGWLLGYARAKGLEDVVNTAQYGDVDGLSADAAWQLKQLRGIEQEQNVYQYGHLWFCPDCKTNTTFVAYSDLALVFSDGDDGGRMKCQKCGAALQEPEGMLEGREESV